MYNYLRVFFPLVCLALNIFVQIFSFRFFSKIGLLKSVFSGFISGFFLLCVLELSIPAGELISVKETAGFFIAHFVTYVSLGYCYFHFVNLGETARRIRILREFRDSPEGLDLEQLLARYNAKEIVDRRVQRLIKNSQIILKNDKYYTAKPVMLLIAKILVALKWMILGKKSEFD